MKIWCIFFVPFAWAAIDIDDSKVKIFKWRGPGVIDETIFTNPTSFDYDFSDDLKEDADPSDLYDQFVGPLPAFVQHKFGEKPGYTRVPIVTRKWATWQTKPDTRGPQGPFATSPMPVQPKFVNELSEEKTTTIPKKHKMIPDDSTEVKKTTLSKEHKSIKALLEKVVTEKPKQKDEDSGEKKTTKAVKKTTTIKTTEATKTTQEGVHSTTAVPTTTKKVRTTKKIRTTPKPTTKEKTTTTTKKATTKVKTTTTTEKPTTTEAPETTTKFIAQPPPVFKKKPLSGRGPIWRKGGRIIFEEEQEETTTKAVTTRKTSIKTTRAKSTRKPTTTTESPTTKATSHTRSIWSHRRITTTTKRPASTTRRHSFRGRGSGRIIGVRITTTRDTPSTTAQPRTVQSTRHATSSFRHRQTTRAKPSTHRATTVRTRRPVFHARTTSRPSMRRIIGVRVTRPPTAAPQRHFSKHTTRASTTPRPVKHFKAQPKPVIIQHGKERHRGPTFNCRVLNPFEDGKPSDEHDSSCKMQYPGLSLDGTCRCFYKVSGRDDRGCATGYLYACKPNFRHSVVV